MGLSNFLKRKPTEPVVSAFDQIPPAAQEAIISDVVNVVETIKGWLPQACISEEHRNKLAVETLALFRAAGTALVTYAVNPFNDASEDSFDVVAAMKKVEFPVTLKRMMAEIMTRIENGPARSTPEST